MSEMWMNVLPGTPVETHKPGTVERTGGLLEPKTRKEYLALNKNARREYLEWIINQFGVSQEKVAEMMGVHFSSVSLDAKKMGINWPKQRMTEEEVERWTRFVAGEPVRDVVWAKNAQTTQEVQEQGTPEETAEQEMDKEGGGQECNAPDPGEAKPEERQELADEEEKEEETKMCVYIAGAISGRTDYKERFAAAEMELREQGNTVMNPAMNGEGWSYRQYINIGLMELMHCDAIYMLRGWQDSVGARLELEYARACGLKILYQED